MTDATTPVATLKEQVRQFVEERNWNQYHSPKNLAMSIAIEAAELMELFQWKTNEEAWQIRKTDTLAATKDELADVLIYCLSLANQLDIDVTQAVTEKMERNFERFPANAKIQRKL